MVRAAKPDPDRRRRGAWYTPPELAQQVCTRALRGGATLCLTSPKDLPQICDPACGDGVFLEAAREELLPLISWLTSLPKDEARAVAEQHLVGVDIDESACSAARARLPHARIIHADFLLDELDLEVPHAFIGNPPFLGGSKFGGVLGEPYQRRLRDKFGPGGNADLCAYFLRYCAATFVHCEVPGVIGFVTTNTIAQGATREFALKPLVQEWNWQIFDATRSMPWPGDAKVSVSVVCMRWSPKDFENAFVQPVFSMAAPPQRRPRPNPLQPSLPLEAG